MELAQWLDKYATRFGWVVVGITLLGFLFHAFGNYWFILALISSTIVLAIMHSIAAKVNKAHWLSAVLWAACAVLWFLTSRNNL